MEAKLAENTGNNKERVRQLYQHLLLNRAYTEPHYDGQQFIIVPLSAGYNTRNNAGGNVVSFLKLVQRTDKSIRTAYVVQFEPESGQAPQQLPPNTFHLIHNSGNGKLPVNGTFTDLDLRDRFLHSTVYKEGEVDSYTRLTHVAINNPGCDGPAIQKEWHAITERFTADRRNMETIRNTTIAIVTGGALQIFAT